MCLKTMIANAYHVGLDWNWFIQEVNQVLQPGDKLLDAGAGECKWREHFPQAEYIGLDYKVGDPTWDFSQVMIEADLNDHIPMPDNSVDVVVSIQVLEHLSNPQQAVKEMTRVLKPGGHLFMTTPFCQHEHQQPYDFYRYTQFGLQHLCGQAGLNVNYIKPMGGYFMLLREQLTHAHHSRFFMGNPLLNLLSWLPRQLVKLLTLGILPPILTTLDGLDKTPTLTLGYTTHAIKPPSQ